MEKKGKKSNRKDSQEVPYGSISDVRGGIRRVPTVRVLVAIDLREDDAVLSPKEGAAIGRSILDH
jgi:hypothetical protein